MKIKNMAPFAEKLALSLGLLSPFYRSFLVGPNAAKGLNAQVALLHYVRQNRGSRHLGMCDQWPESPPSGHRKIAPREAVKLALSDSAIWDFRNKRCRPSL